MAENSDAGGTRQTLRSTRRETEERPRPPGPRARPALRRLPLLAGAALSLAAGLWGGLGLLGVTEPPQASFAAQHGPLMVFGFLGTLIGLERAVALKEPWAYAAPALSALGALVLLTGPVQAGRLLLVAAGGWLAAAYLVVLLRRRPGADTAVQLAGAVAWYLGGLLWLRGGAVLDLVPWMAAFLVLTVAGERLELARVAFLRSRDRAGVLAAATLVGAGAALSAWLPEAGWRTTGLGMLALAVWLAAHDVARRTARSRGLPRYTALCLLAGYFWLALAAAVWTLGGVPSGEAAYDAALHALFLGFVVSMVFGHAPVILPAVLRVRLPYHPVLYGPLVLLHAALAVRVWGDLAAAPEARVLGGLLGEAALLAFAGCAVAAARLARPDRAG